MAFPFSIKGNMTANKYSSAQSYMTEEDVVLFLLDRLPQFKATKGNRNGNNIEFVSRKSMLNFQYQVEMKVQKKELMAISYEYKVSEIFNISLLLAIFVALFSRLDFSGFLMFSFILIALFYLINIWYISTSLKGWLKEIPIFKDSDFEDIHQYIALKPTVCLNCGAQVESELKICPHCKNSMLYDSNDHDNIKYQDITIKYSIDDRD